jgi:hypothetical protein
MLVQWPVSMTVPEKIQKGQTGTGSIFQPALTAVFAYRFVPWKELLWQKNGQNSKKLRLRITFFSQPASAGRALN